MQVEWKIINDSDGHYFINNLGEMRRDSYMFISKSGVVLHRQAKHIKPKYNQHNGYYSYRYRDINGKSKTQYIHRLVAMHFINNPHEYEQVNHIDGNKSNNIVTNLEWCTGKQNMEHASKNGLINTTSEKRKIQCAINQTKSLAKICKPVAIYDEHGDLLKIEKEIGNGCLYRLTYHNQYYREVSILKQKYQTVPQHIDVSHVQQIRTKKRKIYTALLPDGTTETYRRLSELPIQREELYYVFGHQIADSTGRMWEIHDV